MRHEILTRLSYVSNVACVTLPALRIGSMKGQRAGKVDALSRASFITIWAKRNRVAARIIHRAAVLRLRKPHYEPRRARVSDRAAGIETV